MKERERKERERLQEQLPTKRALRLNERRKLKQSKENRDG
jgi:hypothetical protein